MINAFELIHRMGFDFLAATMPEVTCPFETPPDWCVLLELGLPSVFEAEAVMAGIYAEGEDLGLVQDGVIAASEAQRAGLWRIRDSIPEANRRIGAVSSHDISLPLGAVPAFIREAESGGSIALAIWVTAICITMSSRCPAAAARITKANATRSRPLCMIWSMRWGDRSAQSMASVD
jgi:FAD/FMN-containing dehydrogenase